MDNLKELKRFFELGYLEYRRGLTVDCAIFGYRNGELQLLLVKNKVVTQWCLPGGYIKKIEGLEKAAARVTVERTGIENLFLKQFKTFGEPGRNRFKAFDPDKLFEISGTRLKKDSWLLDETASVGFYAITDIKHASPNTDLFSNECAWFPVHKLPRLAFDHKEMVKEAVSALRIHLYHFPVGKSLLPALFTLKEIRMFYEVMAGKALHATNFTNKLVSIGLIEKTDEKRKIGPHRSPTYYRFNEKIYQKALNEGLVLV